MKYLLRRSRIRPSRRPAVYGAALRSLLAGLEKLAEDGVAHETVEGDWLLAG